MKKKFLCLGIACLLGLAGCAEVGDATSNATTKGSSYCNLIKVEDNNGTIVYYDEETKVMYLGVYGYQKFGITPILNADGTPKLYE